ncbi:conserved hypothetical protein [Altererythrobacter sp. B11]|uniref:hypothetical protein n=1 Tax=Altererythrobacter sp. B11 TaxID=2060312 RepID=UPI000DC6DD3B|nr:hypothetical protein [Altererythrobacter sp. B11]BBC72966.1 conserved hypothetical protein [Altererythrobacter sp. B11]
MIGAWPSPAGAGEYALAFDRGRARRLLVLPALFDESNKLRHFTVELLRRLDRAGVDGFLPDLPGFNESLAPLQEQTIAGWRQGAAAAAAHFRATHVLAIRGGALLVPERLPGWRYGAVAGKSLLRALLRARILASREAGREERTEQLLEQGRSAGLELGGYPLGAAMIAQLETAEPGELTDISPADLGGPGLWLRAEPSHSDTLADALAERLLRDLAG